MLPMSSAVRSNTLSPGIIDLPVLAPRHGTLRRRIDRIRSGGWNGIRPVQGVPQPAGSDRGCGVRRVAGADDAAEDFGFDAVGLAEIYFQKDRSVLAAPLIIASALTACTQRVKIGSPSRFCRRGQISHQGKYFQFQAICIMPKPFQ